MSESCNLTVMGSTSVGKSALIIRFVKDTFEMNYDPTIAQTFRREMNLFGINYSLTIYDTAGLEQQSDILTRYIDESQGFLLVYSIDDLQSFRTIQNIYIKLLDEMNGRNVPIVLIGNKNDLLTEQRTVSYEDGKKLADSWHIEFLETSAKKNDKVDDVFKTLVEQIYKNNRGNTVLNNGYARAPNVNNGTNLVNMSNGTNTNRKNVNRKDNMCLIS